MDSVINRSAYFPIQMLHAHFLNFAEKHLSGWQSMEVEAKETVGKKYLIPGYLENTACTCIKELVNKNSSLDDPIVKYLLGYSDYIPKNTMYKRIGKTFQEINETFRFLWRPLF